MEHTLDIRRADLQTSADSSGISSAEDRLERLFVGHQRRLLTLAVRLARDPEEARDLVQETFVRAAGARRIPEGDGAAPWLTRILVNLLRDRWRRRRVRREHAATRPLPDPVNSAESDILARRTVRWALDQLPPRRRAVVVMREIEELDTAETARLLGLAPVTVRWHLMEGRRHLRALLAEETS